MGRGQTGRRKRLPRAPAEEAETNYLDLIPDGVVVVRRDLRLVYANKAAADLIGLPREEISGRPCREAHRALSIIGAVRGMICPPWRVVERGETERTVYRLTTPEGGGRIFSITYIPVRDETGEVIQALEVIRDVTGAEKTKEEVLREAFARDIVGSLSEAYLRDGGLEAGISLTVEKIREFYEPDFIEILLPDGDGKELVLAGGEGWSEKFSVPVDGSSIEGSVYLEDRSVRIADMSGQEQRAGAHLMKHGVGSGLWLPIPAEGSSVVIGVGGICYRKATEIPAREVWVLEAILKDLSVYLRKERILGELKQSNDFVSSILEGIGDGVVVIDRDLRIVNANKGYLDQVKRSREEVVGKHCYEISHNIDRPCYMAGEECSVRQAFETGSSRRIIHTHFDREGRPVYIETVSYPLKDSSGNVVSAIEVLTDVSERVALENEVKERVKDLEDFYEIAVDRELKMIELKKEIAALREAAGKPNESS